MTEWAKNQACWERVCVTVVNWMAPCRFWDELISTEERQRGGTRSARREQRELNGIEAQIAVVKAGPGFWENALVWGTERRLLTPTEEGVLRVAVNRTGKTPTEKQCVRAVEALRKLQAEGYTGELAPGL